MKRVRRIWCLLLALILLAGLFPSFAVPAQAATNVKLSSIGSLKGGSLKGMPSWAENTQYLSALYDTKVVSRYVWSGNTNNATTASREFKKNVNWDNAVYVFMPSAIDKASRYGVNSTNSPRTLTYTYPTSGSTTYTNTEIVLGFSGTKFASGISFIPSPTSSDTTYGSKAFPNAEVVYDVRGLNADYFYAVAGVTGEASNPNTKNKLLQFEVWGSTASEYTADAQFERLAYVQNIRQWLVGEFDVNIQGYNFIKLVAINKSTGTEKTNANLSGSWGGACFYSLPRTDAEVTVEWDDNNNAAGKRPAELTLQLNQNDAAMDGKTVTLNDGNGWTGEVANLYKYSDSALTTAYTYTYTAPADTEDYFFSYADGKVTASYRHTSQAASVNWNDSDNAAGKRPASLEVELLKDGAATGTKLTLNDGNSWTGSFDALARFEAKGQPAIAYSVAAVPASDAYYSYTYNTSTGKIDATYEGQTISVDVAWEDTYNSETVRPTEVKVKLLSKAEGSETPATDVAGIDPITLNAGNGWAGSFPALPKRDAEGNALVYSAALVELPTLHREITDDNDPTTFTLQYDAALTTKSIAVSSSFDQWNHNGNEDTTKHPTKILVGVLADGVELGKTVELNAGNNWAAEFEGLIKANRVSGELVDIVYTFTAAAYSGDEVSADYNAKMDGTTAKVTYIPKTDIAAVVTWAHGDNTDTANQPTSLDVTLYRDNEAVETKTLNAENQWSHTWEKLPLYDDSTNKSVSYCLKVADTKHYVPTVDPSGAITMTYDSFEAVEITPVDAVTQQLPTTLDKIDFLSDMSDGYNNLKVEESMPSGGIYKFRTDFSGTAAIKLGSGSTEFLDGISGLASTSTQAETYIVYDLRDLNADKFYAAAGRTGSADGPVLTFEVYGSTDGTTYKKLAVAKDLTGTQVGVFDVAIADYSYLKLAVRNTGTTNAGATFSWADACVYSTESTGSGGEGSGTPTPSTVEVSVAVAWIGDSEDTSKRPEKLTVQLKKDGADVDGKTLELAPDSWAGKFEGLEAGSYTVSVPADTEYYKFSCVNNTIIAQYQAPSQGGEGGGEGGGETTLPGKYTASANGTYAGVTDAKDGNVTYLSDLTATESKNGGSAKPTYNDTVYGASTKIVIGEADTEFTKGLGVHPQSTAPGYTIYDLTGLDVNRFYAAVGITNTTAKGSDTHKGVRFKVYADFNDGNGYKLLADSDEILKKQSGEFHVDISGAKLLKLEIAANDKFDSCASAWADACVYKYDANGSTPGGSGGGEGGGSTDPLQPNAYTAGTDNGIKAAADPVIYLSERSATDATKGKYITGYYNIHASNDTTKTARYPALDGAFPTSGSDIKIGSGSTEKQYLKGLGVLPSSAREATQNYTLIDLSGIANADRFYAVAGMTGTGKNSAGDQFGVVFEVWGSDQVTTDANDASFKKLTVSTDIFKADSGEFNVDITGYKTLKLVTVTAAGNSGGFNSGCQSVWANACVYKYDANGTNPLPTVPGEGGSTTQLPGVYTPSANGSYQWISGVKDGVVKYLSQMNYTASVNSSGTNNTTYNYPYGGKTTERIIIGEKNTGFTYGLGVHPKAGVASAYTIYDLTGLDVDRFYAAVGITNSKGKTGDTEADGVRFEVYADFQGNGLYTQLAESDKVSLKHTGEFHVDITGAKSLKLVIFSANGKNASCGSAWANACVYKYDPNGSTPNSYTVVGATNTTTTKKTTTTSTTTDNTGLEHIDGFIPSEDGEYTGIGKEYLRTLTWLSSLTYKEAFNTTNTANPDGQPTTLDHPYNALTEMIILGEKDRAFFKGLGVHPKDPTKPVNDSIESWTTYDLSQLNVDRFYAAVGITNEKGKEGASKGVIFKVYGNYGDGEFKLLSHSGCLIGRETGEFDLDISGVKELKLAIVSASNAHASSASAWGNACVYNSADKYDGVGLPEILEPTARPTEPAVEEVIPEVTEPVEAPAEEAAPISTGVIIALAAMGLLILVLLILLILKKKPAKFSKV